jgi:hypothetical protein
VNESFRANRLVAGLFLSSALFTAGPAIAQTSGSPSTSTQIWATVLLDYPHDKTSLFELSIEPKKQVSEGEWRSLGVTPLFEYYPLHWLDLEGELRLAWTQESEGTDSREVTSRLGFRVNFFSNLREREGPVGALFDRVRLATLIRIEYRNLFYTDGSPSSHQWRFRARLESKIGITNADLSRDGTLYGTADIEVFVPFGEDVPERFASKLRTRVGLGYRFSYRCRAEFLYVRDSNRVTKDDPFATSTNAANGRVKIFF